MEVVASAFPPRNDTAQRFDWDLRTQVGRQGFIEATDGDTGDAYAWMAIGRLDEPSEGLLLLTTDGKMSEEVRRKIDALFGSKPRLGVSSEWRLDKGQDFLGLFFQ